jgi:hypothetical protein
MMDFKGITKLTKTVGGFAAKNSPTILTGLSVTGLVTTVIMAVKATPKAMHILENEENTRSENGAYDSSDWPITKKETIQLTWKCYVPAAIMGGATIACIIGAHSISTRRNAALAGLYSLSETALKEYKNKVAEKIGEDKAKEIKDEIDQDTLKRNPASKQEILHTGRGDTLCYDVMSGRYFWSDINDVKAAINNVNKTMRNEMSVCLNDFYSELDLDRIGAGDLLSWYIDYGSVEGDFSSQLADDGRPCLVIDFDTRPKYCDRDF